MKKITVYHENQGELIYYKNDDECDFWIDEQKESEIWGAPDKYTIKIEDVNDVPKTIDGKLIVKADSRPLSLYAYFVSQGDDIGIGDGQEIFWDFSNDDCTISGAPTRYKRKRIVIKQNEPFWLKEGAFYFYDALKGSYADMMIVCPSGQYYYDRDENVEYAYKDTIIVHYVRKHFFVGDCSIGNEFKAEGCSDTPTPANYVIWCQITVPNSDNSSYGWASLREYRARTCLLPGESI